MTSHPCVCATVSLITGLLLLAGHPWTHADAADRGPVPPRTISWNVAENTGGSYQQKSPIASEAAAASPKFMLGHGKERFFGVVAMYFGLIDKYLQAPSAQALAEFRFNTGVLARRLDELNVGTLLTTFRMKELFADATANHDCSSITPRPQGLQKWQEVINSLPSDMVIHARLAGMPSQSKHMQLQYTIKRNQFTTQANVHTCELRLISDPRGWENVWKTYVAKIAEQFGKRIWRYDIWTEPNGNVFAPLTSVDRRGNYHIWSIDEFLAHFVFPAQEVIHQHYPDAGITIGAVGDGVRGRNGAPFISQRYMGTNHRFFAFRDFVPRVLQGIDSAGNSCDARCRNSIVIMPHPFTNKIDIDNVMQTYPAYGLGMIYGSSSPKGGGLTTEQAIQDAELYPKGKFATLFGRRIDTRAGRPPEAIRSDEELQGDFIKGFYTLAYDKFRKNPSHPLDEVTFFELLDSSSGLLRSDANASQGEDMSPRPAFYALKKVIFEHGAFANFIETFDEPTFPSSFWFAVCDAGQACSNLTGGTLATSALAITPGAGPKSASGVIALPLIPLDAHKDIHLSFSYRTEPPASGGSSPVLDAMVGSPDALDRDMHSQAGNGFHVSLRVIGANSVVELTARDASGEGELLTKGTWDSASCGGAALNDVKLWADAGGDWELTIGNNGKPCFHAKSGNAASARHNDILGGLDHVGIRFMASGEAGSPGRIVLDTVKLVSARGD